MRILKLLLIIPSFIIYILLGVFLHIVLIPFSPAIRWNILNRLTRRLISWLKFVLGLRITLSGNNELLTRQGQFIISRHIGYIDGMVLGSIVPATFISKQEIKMWPLIGWVVRVGATIFVDRQNKNKIAQSLQAIEERLKNAVNVLIFPEGTSTDGTKVNPFQSAFFSAPLAARADIVPVAIEYTKIDGKPINSSTREHICWYGAKSFSKHLWNLLQFKTVEVTVKVEDAIKTDRYANTSFDRKKLAQRCYELIYNSAVDNMQLFEGLRANSEVLDSARSLQN